MASRLSQLTPRERDVVALIARGCSDKMIAARLHISYATVRTHVQSAYAKLGVTGRLELLRLIVRSRAVRVRS